MLSLGFEIYEVCPSQIKGSPLRRFPLKAAQGRHQPAFSEKAEKGGRCTQFWVYPNEALMGIKERVTYCRVQRN